MVMHSSLAALRLMTTSNVVMVITVESQERGFRHAANMIGPGDGRPPQIWKFCYSKWGWCNYLLNGHLSRSLLTLKRD